MANKKQYGLMIPKKNQLSAPRAGNVFGNDDDSEEEEGTDWVKKALKAENEKNKIKKQTKLNMQKALKEDPTIFQYDEVYDEMERTKEEEKCITKVEKKPKYIHNLIKSADLRKKEQELRKDRMIQKEIEAEDALFPDKERFVTSSYKAKLEEMKKFEKEQENQDRLEAIGDVTKQKDISGFYRHLYRQTVEKNEADLGIIPKTEEIDNKVELHSDIDKDDSIPSDTASEKSSKSDNEDKEKISKKSSISKVKKSRQYRKRAHEVSESESECESVQEKDKTTEKLKLKDVNKHTSETLDKKQKLSDKIEDENLQESSKPLINENKTYQRISETDQINSEIENVTKNKIENSKENPVLDKAHLEENSKLIKNSKSEEKPILEEKKKINIWQKRTVGPVFEAALQRYLMRKQERLMGC